MFVDGDMRDQYPSIAVLAEREDVTTYRVLMSWFEGMVHRDYEITHANSRREATVRPLGPVQETCSRQYQLSTPIIAKDGREVVARDEATGTTKIFRINEDSTPALHNFG